MHHFVLIIDLLRFVCEVRKQKFRSFLQLCRNCFQIHYNEIDHKTQERLCKDHEPAKVIMPTAENGCHKYKIKKTFKLSGMYLLLFILISNRS